MKTLQMKVLTAVLATLASGITSATPVTSWTVGVNTVFDTTSVLPASGITTSANSLSWGSGGVSGLDITNSPASGTAFTNGAALPNISITHRNQPITGTTLSAVTILSTLTLSPNAFAPSPSVTIPFGVKFLETDNGAAPCADGGANGVGVNINGCADIFVIDQNALNFGFTFDDPDYDPLDATTMLGRQYYISFFELTSGLNSLPQQACQNAASVNACLGFETPEGADTTVRFAALITTDKVTISVPEPGILGLLGLGLAGMGFSLRRKA